MYYNNNDNIHKKVTKYRTPVNVYIKQHSKVFFFKWLF